MSSVNEFPGVGRFIVDNAGGAGGDVLQCVQAWCDSAAGVDVATGHFEIGAMLALREQWPRVREVRILMGGEVSLRTKAAFDRALTRIAGALDASLEEEKQRNDFLDGVDAVAAALRSACSEPGFGCTTTPT